ncbi:MAG: SDR family NAD(P)-dependent oxidoreductase, partial [Candidatus Thermoplasmatota archaeon]|nr:SDR family NAD(P)-dependent oxidoreductase [Candidatus Thermoplasmatota archaeon]
ELFASARSSFDLPRDDTVNLKDFPTLRHIIDYLVGRMVKTESKAMAPDTEVKAPGPEPVPEPVAPAKVYTQEELKARINRWVLEMDELPLLPTAGRPPLEGRKALVIGGGDEGARAVLELLGCEGVQAEPEELIKEGLVLDGIEGVINLYPLSLPNDPLPDDWKGLNEKAVKSLFFSGKSLDRKLKGNGFFLSVTTMGGKLGLDQDVCPINGGVAGITKAIGKEYPTSRVMVLDLPKGTDPQTAVSLLAMELSSSERLLEVGWDGQRRWRPVLRIIEPPSPKVLDLKAGMKFMVSGGGGGITAEILKRLASMQRLELHILDMTPYNDDTKKLAALSEADLKQHKETIKQELLRSGKKLSPVMLERESLRIDRAIGVVRLLEAIERSGSIAVYHSVDVTDMEMIKAIADRHGPFDALLHCAGVDISKMMASKEPSDFNKVYDTKVNGAFALLKATKDHPLKLFMTFTSVSGRFGNAGQVDYSAANDLLDKIGGAVRKYHPDCLVKAVGWSAWAEIGMASRGSIKTLLELGGIAFIPVEDGIGFAIGEMTSGTEREVFYAGTLGPLDSGGQLKWEEGVHPPRAPTKHVSGSVPAVQVRGPAPLIGSVVSLTTRKVVVRKVLDGAKERFLKDHTIMGTMVMPGVMGMELLAETARLLAPDLDVIGIRDMMFKKPVNVEGQLEVYAEGELVEKDGPVRSVSIKVRSTGKDRKGREVETEHYTGTVLLGRVPDVCRAVEGHPLHPSLVKAQVNKAEIYRHFFHGPRFQVTSAIELLKEDELLGIYNVPEQDQFDPSTGWTSADLVLSPLQTELGFQTAGCYVLDRFEMMALPVRVGRLDVFSRMGPSEMAVASVRFRERKENTFSFDVEVLDLSGNVRLSYSDYQLKGLMPFVDRIKKEHTAAFSELPSMVRGIRVFKVDIPEADSEPTEMARHFSEAESMDLTNDRMTEKRRKEHLYGLLAAKLGVSWTFATDRGMPLSLSDVAIAFMPGGKPYGLVAGEKVEISISHSQGVAVASVGKTPHGLDIENHAQRDPSFAEEAFTDLERALMSKASMDLEMEQTMLQTVFFSAKEAYLKRDGKGMSINLRSLECSEMVKRPSREGMLLEIMLNDGEKETKVTTHVSSGLVMSLCR